MHRVLEGEPGRRLQRGVGAQGDPVDPRHRPDGHGDAVAPARWYQGTRREFELGEDGVVGRTVAQHDLAGVAGEEGHHGVRGLRSPDLHREHLGRGVRAGGRPRLRGLPRREACPPQPATDATSSAAPARAATLARSVRPRDILTRCAPCRWSLPSSPPFPLLRSPRRRGTPPRPWRWSARGSARRQLIQADTSLRSYQARAHGFVFFLAQVGQGLTEPPRLVKADELQLEVYWRAPSLSKQTILGWRDGTWLPTDINYHRDHLGVVTNNYGNRIRIGGGDEVRDVIHPLSPEGLGRYDFALQDSLELQANTRTVRVYEVAVRPKSFAEPLVIGTLYLDVETAEVVEFRFSFTPSSYLDAELEDISIVLENALYEGRYWLPERQEIEIRRRTTWLDFPARGIIQGRWEIGDYELNPDLPLTDFIGPPDRRAEAARPDGHDLGPAAGRRGGRRRGAGQPAGHDRRARPGRAHRRQSCPERPPRHAPRRHVRERPGPRRPGPGAHPRLRAHGAGGGAADRAPAVRGVRHQRRPPRRPADGRFRDRHDHAHRSAPAGGCRT